MCASDRAIVPTRSGSYTPSTCASAPAGLVSGPSTLKIVRIPSSLRGPMTAFIAGWKTGASMNPIPSVSIASSTAGGSASTSAPATSSTSALPDEGGHRVVAVLGDRDARARRDDRGGRRDVDCVVVVAAGPASVDERLPVGLDRPGGVAHPCANPRSPPRSPLRAGWRSKTPICASVASSKTSRAASRALVDRQVRPVRHAFDRVVDIHCVHRCSVSRCNVQVCTSV